MNKRIRRLMALLLILVASSQGVQAQTFDPDDPPEPALKYKVTVGVIPNGAGYPSGAGKFVKGQQVYISTSDVYGFKFLHWTLNGAEYSTDHSFWYTVGTTNAAFVAVYEYDPQNPDEPVSNPSYRLYLDCQPKGACSFNRTSGEKVAAGTNVYLYASPSQSFDFLGWYEGETMVNSNISFNYPMTAADHQLVARFEYNPADPDDPMSASTEGVDNTVIVPGDANGDGSVSVTDIMAVAQYIMGTTIEGFNVKAADVNNDNTVSVTDIMAIANIIMNSN